MLRKALTLYTPEDGEAKMRINRTIPATLGALMSALALTSAHAADSGFRLMMTPKWTGFSYFEAARKGAEEAAKELGDSLVYAGADHADVTLQVETLQNFVTQKPNAILVAAIDQNSAAPVLTQARKRGILVVTWDADAAIAARDMFINSMSADQGARTLLDCALLDAPEGGEVAFVSASPTAQNHMQWINRMRDLIKTEDKYKVFKVVGETQYAEDDETKSYSVATNLMQAHPNLKVIIAPSSVTGPVAARAIEATGRTGKTFAVSWALPDQIKSFLKDGSEKAFALWNPAGLGYVTVYAAHLKLAGKLEIKPGATFEAGKEGTFTMGQNGEIDYGKALIFTAQNVDQAGF